MRLTITRNTSAAKALQRGLTRNNKAHPRIDSMAIIIGAPIENHSGPYCVSMTAKEFPSQALANAETRNINPKKVVQIYERYFMNLQNKKQATQASDLFKLVTITCK